MASSDVVSNLLTIQAVTQDNTRLIETNKRLLKALASLAVTERQQRDALQAFCDWNTSDPEGLSTDAGLKRLSRAMDQAERLVAQKPPEIPEEVWDATE